MVGILLELKVFLLLPPRVLKYHREGKPALAPLSSSSAEMTDVKVSSNHDSQQSFSFLQPYS